MFVTIDLYSKSYASLKKFHNYFNNENLFQKLKIFIIKMNSIKPLKKNRFTVLKSPHVNKSAQEQFEIKMYKKRVKLFVPQILIFLFFLKRLKLYSFSDVKFKINLVSNLKSEKKKTKNGINIDNYYLYYKELDLIKYLKMLSLFGEYCLKAKRFR